VLDERETVRACPPQSGLAIIASSGRDDVGYATIEPTLSKQLPDLVPEISGCPDRLVGAFADSGHRERWDRSIVIAEFGRS
jgi:hypothetical protein